MSASLHSIDEMARAGCTSPRGIRHWEELGLLGSVSRSVGAHRLFTDEQLDRAKIIAAAQFGGWSLEEISEMVQKYDQEVYDAIVTRLTDQIRAAVRLGENLPLPPPNDPNPPLEYDL